MEGQNLTITVEDKAGGISLEMLKENRLFSGITTKDEGTGIGLSTGKKIMQILGGDIAASNIVTDKGPGACFKITMPIR